MLGTMTAIKWVDVTKMLPKDGEQVLVLSKSPYVSGWSKHLATFKKKNVDEPSRFWVRHDSYLLFPTYWAYFPEAPEYPKDSQESIK